MNLIDRLPSHSHYVAEVAADEEAALAAADSPEAKPTPPRLTEWSPELAALAVIADRLGALINVQIARGGGKPSKTPPYPRPVTALQQARQLRRIERHNDLVARLLPPERRLPTT